MSFIERCESNWQNLPIAEREALLSELSTAISRKPEWWDGLSAEELSHISDFNDLPSGLADRLILASTEEGFTVGEFARVQRKFSEIIQEIRGEHEKHK